MSPCRTVAEGRVRGAPAGIGTSGAPHPALRATFSPQAGRRAYTEATRGHPWPENPWSATDAPHEAVGAHSVRPPPERAHAVRPYRIEAMIRATSVRSPLSIAAST